MITLSGHQVLPTIFPDSTSQVWQLDTNLLRKKDLTIKWDFESEDEFLYLAQLKDLLDTMPGENEIKLYMPYLPYGRQDKEISNQSTFALRTFTRLIKSLSFDSVTVFDAHSDVSGFKSIQPIKEVYMAFGKCDGQILCYPDEGASKKYKPIFDLSSIEGRKDRDQATGKIISYTLYGHCKDKRVLIVDDICDGGATFILLAKALFNEGAREVHLYVSHGIFSKGIQILRDAGISRIFTKQGEVT